MARRCGHLGLVSVKLIGFILFLWTVEGGTVKHTPLGQYPTALECINAVPITTKSIGQSGHICIPVFEPK